MSAPVSPRVTRLLRVPTLAAGQDTLAALVAQLDVPCARDTVFLVPSAAASAQLRRTVERLLAAGRVPTAVFEQLRVETVRAPRGAICFPVLTTRAGLYALLHARIAGAPPALDDFSREALMRAAAWDAAAGTPPPFTVRPGILAEMLAFYDALRRLRRSVDDVERLLVGALSNEAEADRGAARLLEQTRFLVAAYRAFDQRCAAVDGVDEHGVRELVLGDGPRPAVRHVVVCVSDVTAEPGGLWPADFDMLTRLPGLERIDVLATDAVLSAGFDERLEQRLPGIVTCRVDPYAAAPVLRVPDAADAPRHFLARDREEELNWVAREVKRLQRLGDDASAPDDHAIVVQRPLPYLYLARHTLDAAGVPWTASDALPLAAEPYAAVVDLAGEAVLGECARAALTALLGSPHLRIRTRSGSTLGHDDVRRLDEELERASFFGGFDLLRTLLASRIAEGASASPAGQEEAATPATTRLAEIAAAVLEVVDALAPLARPARLSDHAARLLAWLDRFEAPVPAGMEEADRRLRARAAVRTALRRLLESSLAHHDPEVELRDVLATLRRWIEARTFQPRVGEAGVHLLEADAARFADAARVWVLGVVDGDWPAATRRDVFYPSSLLSDLGWPRETERTAAARAQFVDMLSLARAAVSVSAFTLEDDAIVEPAVLLEELDHATLPVERVPLAPPPRTSTEDALWMDPVPVEACRSEMRPWLAMRQGLAGADASRFQGRIGAWSARSHTVTQVDTWVECPFRYFARHVLKLDDEAAEEPGLSPRQRGELVHAIFERFFVRWSADGRGAITADTLEAARAMFAEVTEEVLASVDAADAAIERTRLLGSAVASGMADRVLDLEVDRGLDVEERRLEEKFEGSHPFTAADGTERVIAIRGKADRIDLLAGGRLHLVDYKTGRAPARGAVQLPIYAHVAERRFEGYRGRQWKAAAADYIAFRGRPVTHALGRKPEHRDERLREAQAAFVAAVDAIAAGEFPPRPAELRMCTWCPYDAVCRKDYVDAEEEAEPDGPA